MNRPCSLSFLFIILISAIYLRPSISRPGELPVDSKPGLSASLDKSSVLVGGILQLTLKYRLPEGAVLSDDPKIKGLEDLNIIERHIGPKEIRIKILVDRIGSWKTGPLSLAYTGEDGMERTLNAGALSVDVVSNLGEKPEEARLKPIQGIIPITALWIKYMPWIIGAILLLAIGFGLYTWYYRRKKGLVISLAPDPPHIKAIKDIEALEAESLFEKGFVKDFYFRFSEIMRFYLESIRGFPAAEFTTEEIAFHMNNEKDRGLLPLLRQADLVKFAETVPTPARKEEEVKKALSYIHETSPTDKDLQSLNNRKGVGP